MVTIRPIVSNESSPSLPEWPSHFPTNCPPADALDLNGTVFLLIATDPPTDEDMKCAIDRGTHRNKPECLRAALSCAVESDHLEEVRQASPRLKHHKLACASLKPHHGKIKQTGSPGHHSMWMRAQHLAIGYQLFSLFSVLS